MKLIFICDTHGQGSSPGSRLDDFPSALLNKLKYISSYAVEIGATAILHGGDWIHTPDVSEAFIGDFCKVIKDSTVPWYGILGNHDIYGYNPSTFKRTTLGVGEALGSFTRLYIDSPVIFKEGHTKVALTGCDSHANLDKGDRICDYTDSTRIDDAVNIHIVHGMLTAKKWEQVSYTLIDDIVICNADIILTGHEHTGFGVVEKENRLFCNPGSLSRITAATGDIRKDVRMAVITIEGNSKNIDLINLPVGIARPASEVIDYEKLQQEKARKEQLNNFIADVNVININKDFNIHQTLNQLCESDSIPNDVLDECRKQLEIAEEQMKKEE